MRRNQLILSISLCLFAALTASAVGPSQASGNFEGKTWTFKADGAFAFPSNDEPGIRVAVSNRGFVADNFEHVWDREHYIDTLFKDAETLVVYFDFSLKGKYEGMSYSFGSGDGCGLCYDGAVKSTVKVEKGRIQGRLTSPKKKGEVSFDISFDVPVATSDYGKALPAGFGEQGKLYAAYHKALDSGSIQAVGKLLTTDYAAEVAENGPSLLSALVENHPTKNFKITKGFTKGDRTLLLVEGENSYVKVKTEVHLVLEKGTWKVEDEIMQVRMGE